jgi:hypothetical protein
MCSASKIKCNKAKPICSRCDKLGCHCSYSPTRRMGRPHPPRHAQSQIMPKVTREPAKRLGSVQTRHESFEPESDTSVNESRGPHQSEIREKRPKTLRATGTDFDFNEDYIPDGQGPAILQSQPVKARQRDEYIFKESSSTRQKDPIEGVRMFNFNGQIITSEADGFLHQAMSNDDNSMLLSSVSSQSRRTSSTIDKLSGISSYGEGSASSNACEEDCATLAMNTLEDLNRTSLKRAGSGTSLDEMETESLDGPMKIVSMAVKCISTILVCPCLQKTDVRLLAATVCTAILDTYGVLIRNSTHRQSVRVLEELPKVASLVMQFNKRCSQDAKEYSGNLLPALGASLKSRLQSMTNEAVDCLAQD